ncbi:MAG: hypothetical protein EPN93_04595 [Spirochaetes bacterium]|nr:MAG: hypothetical protein EPN93_04595 [Spirochaetota bacterium]
MNLKKISVELQDGSRCSGGTVFMRPGEKAVFRVSESAKGMRWFLIKADCREYDQFAYWKSSRRGPMKLAYRVYDTGITDAAYSIIADECGTIYLYNGNMPHDAVIAEDLPLQVKYTNRIFQITVRFDDTYTGYLSELSGTPFILPPGPVGDSHQTDLRMGSDCAEFAIYGMRRMQRKIPYTGPGGILDHLTINAQGCVPDARGLYHDSNGKTIRVEKSGVQRGDIIHFGAQVSVFYEDRGIPGLLDKDDILMQSYGSCPVKTTFEHCSFYHYPFKVGQWK